MKFLLLIPLCFAPAPLPPGHASIRLAAPSAEVELAARNCDKYATMFPAKADYFHAKAEGHALL